MKEHSEMNNYHLTAPIASNFTIPPPPKEESTDSDVREPLREISKYAKDNQEVPSHEQEQEAENTERVDKLNDYVTKILEKLVNQKNKMAKLASVLEKKGLSVEKKDLHIENMVQEFEEIVSKEKINDENYCKENLSPVKSKHSVAKFEDIAHHEERVTSPKGHGQSSITKFNLKDILQISRSEISFGTRLPGQIVEEHFEIVNKSGHDFVVQIFLSCLNEELQNTDEYVYSVRRSHLYDYNDKHYLIMAPHSCAEFKFALKVPNLKLKGHILGEVKVSIQGLSGEYNVDLSAKVTIPKVFCPKELSCLGLDYKVIKLAVKEGKKQDIKIPIKNTGDVPVTLELEFHEPSGCKNSQERALFDCMIHPNVITIPAKGTTLTNVLIKPWKILSAIKDLGKQKPSRKILVGKVRDSVLVYSFVFWIEIY